LYHAALALPQEHVDVGDNSLVADEVWESRSESEIEGGNEGYMGEDREDKGRRRVGGDSEEGGKGEGQGNATRDEHNAHAPHFQPQWHHRRQVLSDDEEGDPTDNASISTSVPSPIYPPMKRQRIAYILIPPLPTHASTATGNFSVNTVPMLDDTTWRNLPLGCYTQGPYEAFKYSFGINLETVPGRTRKGPARTGRFVLIHQTY